MPDLITTVAGESSNAYVSLEESNSYHETKLHNPEWLLATEEDKQAAIIWATRLLDSRVSFVGYKYDPQNRPYEAGTRYPVPALEWPRSEAYDSNGYWIDYRLVPREVKNATSELAYLLIKEDRTAARSDPSITGLKTVKIGPLAIAVDKTDRNVDIPESVIGLLKGLGSLNNDSEDMSISIASVARS